MWKLGSLAVLVGLHRSLAPVCSCCSSNVGVENQKEGVAVHAHRPDKQASYDESNKDAYFSTHQKNESTMSTPSSAVVNGQEHVVTVGVDPMVLDHYPSLRLPSYAHVRWYKSHLVSVDYRTRIPAWVAERFSRQSLGGPVDRRDARFVPDRTVPRLIRAENKDYLRSGYQRGHLAAAAAHKKDLEEMQSTFVLSSNIVPQSRNCNVSIWAALEKLSRRLATSYASVYVVSGPLWMPPERYANKSIRRLRGTSDVTTGKRGSADKQEDVAYHVAQEQRWFEKWWYSLQQAVSRWLAHRMLSKLYKAETMNSACTYDVIGERCIAVPTHLFKIVLATHPLCLPEQQQPSLPSVVLAAFVVPNTNDYAIDEDMRPILLGSVRSVEYIEFYSGLDFSGLMQYVAEYFAHMLSVQMAATPLKYGSKTKNLYQPIVGGDQLPQLIALLER